MTNFIKKNGSVINQDSAGHAAAKARKAHAAQTRENERLLKVLLKQSDEMLEILRNIQNERKDTTKR